MFLEAGYGAELVVIILKWNFAGNVMTTLPTTTTNTEHDDLIL